GRIEVDMCAALDDGKNRINVGGTDADNDERRGPQAPLNAIEPGLAKEWSAENDQSWRREDPEQEVNPRKQPRIDTCEGTGIQKEAEQHDVHGEKAAHAEADQEPGRLPLFTLPAPHLKGDTAAIAAERTILAVHSAPHRARPDGQQAMAAQAIVCHAGCPPGQPCAICAAIGRMPRPRVIRPSSRMQLPANHTPRCRHAGARTWPTPPIINMAGKVPNPNDAMVRKPGSAPAVLVASATKAYTRGHGRKPLNTPKASGAARPRAVSRLRRDMANVLLPKPLARR